jgi:hypothetical protein
VRDARELISIGQTVRVRVLDGSTPRVALSLKNVGPRPRGPQAPREGGRERGERPERGERGERGRGRAPAAPPAPVRAAQSRRDGLVTGRGGGRGRDERGGRGGPGRGPGRGGPPNRGGKREREESARPEDLRAASSPKVAYNPFADFFKGARPGVEEPPAQAESEAAP